jgi:aminoglycoside phosphotransferase (APT) family kinase protein
MADREVEARLEAWLATCLPDARSVGVEGLDRASLGHSAETLLCTIAVDGGSGAGRHDVVIRLRPPDPGLLPPYDLGRQFAILVALAETDVRAPRAWWHEPTGEVLGRELYVMERLPGTVYEQGIPDELRADPDRARRMCEHYVDQLAAIHMVDLVATGLGDLGDGRGYLDRELAHWHGEVERVRRAPLPGLARLHAELRAARPETSAVTLVHGDAKLGNYAFVDDDVTAVFDWEMATIGDPMADIGWAEMLWNLGDTPTNLPGSPTTDEFVARWEARTGLRAHDRGWYRAMQIFKMCAIALVAGRLFDDGHSDDPRLGHMTYAIAPMTGVALRELGVDEEVDPGPVLADLGRLQERGGRR